MSNTYLVNEIFHSIQGEGVRAGTANIFIRFAACNQTCSVESHGFDCDTEFASGRKMTAQEMIEEAITLWPLAPDAADSHAWAVFTGGEPLLQVDMDLIEAFRAAGWRLALETNGSLPVPEYGRSFDWVCVSPKVAEHAIRQTLADEVKYVRGYGQAIPRTVVSAKHYIISPAFDGSVVQPRTLAWCVDLVKANPRWRLSLQTHKILGIR